MFVTLIIFFNSELAVTQIYHVDCIIPRSSGKTVISLGFRAGKHQQRAKCLIVSKWSHLRNRLIRRKCPQSTCTVHNILHKYTQVHTSTHHPTQVPSKHLHSTHHSTTKEHYSTHHPTTIERAPSNALQGSDIVIQYTLIHSGYLPH